MQRVLEAAAGTASTCAACGTSSSDDRCGHCGAAARAGAYRVLRVLSRSPHGAMYLAEDGAGAKVALKELVFSLVPATQELDAFTREAELLRALDHPRIPKFLQSFTVGQGVSTRLYLAQQFLPGVSLAQQLVQEHFDEAGVLALARQALEVLRYLHGRSPVVVHRDVKPDNFILGADGALSLVDFGAARSVKAAGTHRATLVGTFGYMAPEQLGGTVDGRSDLYGLGATLVHLLTRTPPERLLGPGMTLDFQKHVNVSAQTERFLTRLVATRPEERFASAEDALAFLDGKRVALAATRRSRRTLTFAAFGIAAVLGASVTMLALRSTAHEAAAPEVVAPALPAPSFQRVASPPAGEITFPWIQAKWDFSKPGHWVLDQSGRGHHALLPESGFANDFFGLKWDGTSGLSTPDSVDFAPTGPFTITTRLTLSEGPLTKAQTLISRGDPDGTFAWKLQIVPVGGSRKLRFTIADPSGETSSVEGFLPPNAESWTLFAQFDPKAGEMKVSSNCVTIGKALTSLRPARTLPPDARLQLLTGVRGVVSELELSREVIKVSAGAGCSWGGDRLGED